MAGVQQEGAGRCGGVDIPAVLYGQQHSHPGGRLGGFVIVIAFSPFDFLSLRPQAHEQTTNTCTLEPHE